jgi:hypothetical protein
VFGGLNRPLVAAVAAVAFLAAPSAAFACNSGVSAVSVYSECQPSGSGGKSTSQASGGATNSGGGSTGSTSAPISNQTAKALRSAGQDQQPLTNLVRGLGGARLLQSHDSATEPSAVGSAFDVGSGPTALLIVLACTAILLLGATGFRGVRRRRG